MKTTAIFLGILLITGLFTGLDNSQNGISKIHDLKAELQKEKERDSLTNLVTKKAILLNKLNNQNMSKKVDTLEHKNNILVVENKVLETKVISLDKKIFILKNKLDVAKKIEEIKVTDPIVKDTIQPKKKGFLKRLFGK